MSVQVHGVRKRFGRTTALDGLSLDVGGGVTGLLGPNGAGKTTLLRIVATVLAADSGTVSVLGRDPGDARQRAEIRRRLGYLPQDVGAYNGFSVREFVDYIAVLKEHRERRARRAEVERVLELVDLTDQAYTRVKSLSGGMRRRLGLATAYLGDPELLVLDEPAVGLDPQQRLRFRELVSNDPARTILLSTHQTDDVAALCRDVIVVNEGRVLFRGSPAELAASARGRVWRSDAREPGAELAWVAGDGTTRMIGDPPPGADLVEPTVEDAYLVLVGATALQPVEV
ncbi:MAG TPA: ATP-binding cassette domain-containing protein [Mycobacteriales bacterium]|jgi:ABC-2 type transport system ATP-binding protein|nr:ATP-binding cassette domain-containing protein [Mycobacteriales bacterium]